MMGDWELGRRTTNRWQVGCWPQYSLQMGHCPFTLSPKQVGRCGPMFVNPQQTFFTEIQKILIGGAGSHPTRNCVFGVLHGDSYLRQGTLPLYPCLWCIYCSSDVSRSALCIFLGKFHRPCYNADYISHSS